MLFENIDVAAIQTEAKKVRGAAGPSGGDADLWQRLLCTRQLKRKPAELCQALAHLSRKLNTVKVNPDHLRGFVSGRLIPLDKQPGVRPIGIGEVPRRIVSTATVSLLKPDLVAATAPCQTCAGIPGGIEASIHAMRKIFNDAETEAVLLVDASNAFNSMNRQAALHNIEYSCPEIATFVRNIYGCEAELFLPNSDEVVLSKEGTTQGGPESMAFYAASMLPLCRGTDGVKAIFYADDGGGGGKLEDLRVWWEGLNRDGPQLGYFPNAGKTWLVTKPEHLARASNLFPDVNITAEGHEYLGSCIGTQDFTEKFVDGKVADWTKDIDALIDIASHEPQLAYSAYVFGVSRKWQFVCRTTPDIADRLGNLEFQVRTKLLPALMAGRQVSDEMRAIFSLPARNGGLSIFVPTVECSVEYEYSLKMTAQLKEAIFNQDEIFDYDEEKQNDTKREVQALKTARFSEKLAVIKSNCTSAMARLIDLASEKGASGWLTSLPLAMYGFHLNKLQFQDALCMRYDLALSNAPRKCVCGSDYSINHCLTCKNGGFVSLRHNTLRNTIHDLLKEVCKDVRKEPLLLPVTGEVLPPGSNVSDGARADVSALGFWIPLNRAFFDVRVVNPLAQSNRSKEIPVMYENHEKLKKREYNARVLQIEKGTFSPLIFSCSGGMGVEAGKFVKALAAKVAEKRGERYSQTVHFLRRRLCFDLLRTCILSFRGERGNSSLIQELSSVDIGLCHLID